MIQNILDNEGLNTYLEDITSPAILVFPKQELIDEINNTIVVEMPNLTGIWRSSIDEVGKGVTSEEKTLNIHQENDNISAEEVVTYLYMGEVTVVQQSLKGKYRDNTLTLNGVNYTFIQRGKQDKYYLDNYTLTLSEDGNELAGTNEDFNGECPNLTYKKNLVPAK